MNGSGIRSRIAGDTVDPLILEPDEDADEDAVPKDVDDGLDTEEFPNATAAVVVDLLSRPIS